MRDRTENQMKYIYRKEWESCLLTGNVTLVFIRHGATKANRERRYLGRTDEPLSEEGADTLRSYRLRRLYPKADCLFVSPMKRCLETAEILYPHLCPVKVLEWREMDFGLFEYRNYEELKGNVQYQAWLDSNGTLPFPQGEDRETFILRSEAGFKKVCGTICRTAEENQGRTVTAGLVVHGGTIMALLSRYWGGDYFDYQVPNGKGYVCRIRDFGYSIRMAEPEPF